MTELKSSGLSSSWSHVNMHVARGGMGGPAPPHTLFVMINIVILPKVRRNWGGGVKTFFIY